jgi:LmbE family N-acetylglucosaminyl deacetylase
MDESGRYLFLFAHPDDETFIAGTMRKLLNAGASVFAAWLTSGDYFGGGERREYEHSKAMHFLGLPPKQGFMLRFPDLGLVLHMPAAADRVEELVREIQPNYIFANAYEGGHPDHDVVNFLAYESAARAGVSTKLFEFPLYNGNGRLIYLKVRINSFPTEKPEPLYNRLKDDEIECKHAMMKAYSTQWMYMIPARLASPKRLMRKRGEAYRPCPQDRDHTQRPHPGTLSYERPINSFMKITFKDFTDAVRRTRAGKK